MTTTATPHAAATAVLVTKPAAMPTTTLAPTVKRARDRAGPRQPLLVVMLLRQLRMARERGEQRRSDARPQSRNRGVSGVSRYQLPSARVVVVKQ